MKVQIDREIEELVPDYLENRRKELAEFQLCIDASNFTRLKTLGHRLAGNAGGYGLPDLGFIGSKIEKDAVAQDLSKMPEYLQEIKFFLDHLEIEFI